MRRVLERIRRLTVPRSVIGKLAELEARDNVQALRQHEQTLTAQHQLLQQSQTALNARYEALQSAYEILEIAHQDLATRQQADLAETQRSLKEWSERCLPRPPRADGQDHPEHREVIATSRGERTSPRPSATARPSTSSVRRSKPRFRACFRFGTNCSRTRGPSMRSILPASLSVEGNRSSAAFGKFLSLYAHGSVLDVGCGIQEFPSYLDGLVIDRLAGVDPLASQVERKFEFVQGFAEFLPWENEEFDLVVAATSLDHVVSLDMALSEIKRVLRPGGYFVTWVGFVAGAKPYDPTQPNISPIDRFHLFHFDREWFVELMTRYFTLEEEFALDFESHFFAFLKA